MIWINTVVWPLCKVMGSTTSSSEPIGQSAGTSRTFLIHFCTVNSNPIDHSAFTPERLLPWSLFLLSFLKSRTHHSTKLSIQYVHSLFVSWDLSDLVVKFTDSDGGVAAEFVQRLQNLNATNSERELSVDKFLTKSEESFFNKVRKRKLNDAASITSSYREPVWGEPGGTMYSSLACMSFFI